MEERKLTSEEIKELEKQYFDMTDDLKRYRKLFWKRKFWKASKEARKGAFYQYRFFHRSLNETLLSLIKCEEWYNNVIVCDAIKNRFVTVRTKAALLKSIL